MSQKARPEHRTILGMSAALAARVLHDAGADGALVRVTDPQTIRALERGFLRLLSDTRRPYVMQVSSEVASGLRHSGSEPVEATRLYNLALGFDRFGRGVFLLRPAPLPGSEHIGEARRQADPQMAKDLQRHLRSIRSLDEDEEL